MKKEFILALKGAAMGVAEVIPGVSGGTIAFITGIYERLLDSIKSFGPGLLKDYQQGGISGIWEAMDGRFLLTLLLGMAGGIVVGVFGVSHLMETVPEILWAFFFGLIIASAIYIGRQVSPWSIWEVLSLLVGIAVAFGITLISPAEGNESLWFVFLSGMIAISALILPGISGSFILLLLGMYTVIIPKVKEALKLDMDSLGTVIVFGLGCLLGLATFSRLLSWTFKHHKNITLALLTGFMIGSLNKIWPWRMPTLCLDKETGEQFLDCNVQNENLKILMERNVSPFSYLEMTGQEAWFAYAILAMVAGFAVVFLLERMSTDK